jgi:hypothetical protein
MPNLSQHDEKHVVPTPLSVGKGWEEEEYINIHSSEKNIGFEPGTFLQRASRWTTLSFFWE